jgi:hypothetical protein
MPNLVHPIIHLSNGQTVEVLGIDGGRAPALDAEFVNAPSPEAILGTVHDAILHKVALFVEVNDNCQPEWATINPVHVVSTTCAVFG